MEYLIHDLGIEGVCREEMERLVKETTANQDPPRRPMTGTLNGAFAS